MNETPFDLEAPEADASLDLFTTTHGSIELHCARLRRLGQRLAKLGSDETASVHAVRLLRYFDGLARLHHKDEEINLFPTLADAMPEEEADLMRELTAALASDHRRLEAMWNCARVQLARVAAGESAAWNQDVVNLFIDAYLRHIQTEDSIILPAAAQRLSGADLQCVARAMRARRAAEAV